MESVKDMSTRPSRVICLE